MVWRCFSYGIKKNQNAPFGYLKVSSDLQSVHLHILPYNYPVFLQLLGDICDHKRMTEAWGHQFVNYLGTIPKYYFMPLAKAFERIGFVGMIKPEAIDRALPYQLKHSLQKLRHSAKIEYDNFVRMTQTDSPTNPTVTLPSALLPLPLWPLREFKSMYIKPKRLHSNSLRPCNISRTKLRVVLGKMRHELDNLLNGSSSIRAVDLIHQQPVALMGDYVNYRNSRQVETPLREINPTPERSDTFGNPFRRKSTSFVADEGFVDEMDSLQVNSCNPNTVLLNFGRKKSAQTTKNPQARVKGPLPPYINHLNWRFFSPKSSPLSSPRSSDNTFSEEISSAISSPTYADNSPSLINHSRFTNQAIIEKTNTFDTRNASSLESFKLNKKIMFELIHLVRQPYTVDAVLLFDRMNELTGSIGQREAVVSMLMSEALRFRRSCLYFLLSDWRTWLLQIEILSSLISSDHNYELGVCCVGENNILSSSGGKSQPAILGVIFNIKTNQINPARISWKARGPVPALRLLRLNCVGSDEITNVFNPERCYLTIDPFPYVRPAFVDAQITSEEIRARSTTPEQEPATYFEGQIAVHRLRLHCPNSLSWFGLGPLIFRCVLDSNKPWVPINGASTVASEDPLTNVEI
ncbi:unnamed protein product [Schistosoma intercalatum]|nr:unnamed protein product [Schistosoma intercalatum]